MVINAKAQRITSDITVKATLKVEHKALRQAEALLKEAKKQVKKVA